MEVLEVEKCQPWNDVLAFPEFLSTFFTSICFQAGHQAFPFGKVPC